MRQAFINTLIQLAEQDKAIWLLTADIGFGVVEQFATKFPKRYINVGVAEQNMIGVATGLALEGKKVFCYSIANFPTLRCLEQIRNDVCYHNLPICIVSGGAGLWYGNLGMTHWAVEDIAVMRALPNMAIVSPAYSSEMEPAVRSLVKESTPCYLRMTRSPTYPASRSSDFQWGKAIPLLAGQDVALVTSGGITSNAIQATIELSKQGVQAGVLDVHTIKPLDWQTILDAADGVKVVITIEEHSRIGGLGSAVAEVLAGMKHHPPLVRMGTRDEYPTTAMSYEDLLRYHHLTVEDIVKETEKLIGEGG